jgi:seryl-tRNA synthetase
VVKLAAAMGFSAQATYDVEVWLPGQQKYQEMPSSD